MDNGPLVREEIEAGEQFVRAFDHYAPIKAAFWLKASDDDHRYLYLSSDRIDDISLAYGEVWRLAKQLDLPDFDIFRVKVIRGDHPLAQEAAAINQRFPGSRATRMGGRLFGGLFVDDVYLYPPLAPAAV